MLCRLVSTHSLVINPPKFSKYILFSLQTLKSKGYGKLLLQIGDGRVIPEKSKVANIEIDYYKFKPSIAEDLDQASLVISHAGINIFYAFFVD